MMIFQHTWKAVLDSTKTQTRRLVKPGDELLYYDGVYYVSRFSTKMNDYYTPHVTSKTYAVQPGRGQKAVGRIRITGIRQERLQDMATEDAIAEGMSSAIEYYRTTGKAGYFVGIRAYRELWDAIHTKRGERWQDDPAVWVLEFELVKGGE